MPTRHLYSQLTSVPEPSNKRKQDKRVLKVVSRLLFVAACLVLLVGVGLSVREWHDNNVAIQRAAKAVAAANQGVHNGVPSTIKPTASTFASYTVAADLPRYIFIPELSVQAIVRPLGLLPSGQLEAPTNVYDTGWYTGSSKPGQPGAMLIDGHVSSWTAQGVFYGIKMLRAGDTIQIEKGDGTLVTYTVVKSQVYDASQVDMTTVLAPVDATKPGLNLITCTGDVIQGTSDFNERIVIFAEENT